MAPQPTARNRAREQITADITEEARRQLAVSGAAALSLRSVARALGMVSSAVYRYVPSRDELLTRLIVEAYDSLGAAAEEVLEATDGDAPTERLVLVAHAIRDWAIAHRHEYALLYGSPVPGYAAPQTTVESGIRPSLALLRVVADAKRSRQFRTRRRSGPSVISEGLAADFAELRSNVDLEVGDETVLDVLMGWTQLFGLISFELFGQTRGVISQHRDMYEASARRMASHVGLM